MTTATLLDTVQQVTDQDRVEAVYRAKTDEFPYHTDLEVEVEIYLRRIDPEFVNQWKGSWQALYSNNPDRYRQAAHSGRELLNHIMHTLAPDACFSPEEVREKGQKGRPTRKMRIARILGSSIGKKPGSTEIAFVDATVQFVDTLYDSLTARAHDHSGVFRFVELKGYLTVLNGVIVHLLAER